MMFDFFTCRCGFMVGLGSVAKGMRLVGKTEGISGATVPRLWADGKFDEVLRYVAQDALTTLHVTLAAVRRGEVRWVTQRGSLGVERLTGSCLTVPEASALPLPGVSWMDRPLPRSHFTEWLGK
jgi:hypothetical protein